VLHRLLKAFKMIEVPLVRRRGFFLHFPKAKDGRDLQLLYNDSQEVGYPMISDELLDQYRLSGEKIRVVRDGLPENDVRGIVVAWDDTHVLIRKPNRNVVKLDRNYIYQPAKEPRISPVD
jgi:hypothetical protein